MPIKQIKRLDMFVVHLKYKTPLDEVLKVRPRHVEFLEKFYSENVFLFSGRRYDSTGGIIIANLSNEDEVHEIMKEDPFIKENVANYEVVGFDVSMKSKNISL